LMAVTVASTHLHCLSMRHLPSFAATQWQKMSFYQHYFIKEWSQAVRELEVLASLLSYCARTWKGEKMLACILQDKPTHPDPPSHPPSHASSRSRPPSSLSHSHSRASTPGLAPPSSVGSSSGVPSSVVNPSSTGPSSHLVHVSLHCAALILAVHPGPWPAVPATLSKGVKAMHRHEPSPS
jgi:hypothetical protein